jgi:hypothetical protein
MTPEQHRMIVKAGLRLLLAETDKDLARFHPWMTKAMVEFCLNNPSWPEQREIKDLVRETHRLIREVMDDAASPGQPGQDAPATRRRGGDPPAEGA